VLYPSNIVPPSLHFSGHETFPLRQLWLRKAYENIRELKPSAPKMTFSDEEAIVRFGVGKNMAMSIRHWALACGMMQEGENGGFVPTDLARKIFEEFDPYSEHPATAWLLHWQLAGIGHKSTTWWWLFNCIPQQTFDRDAVISSLKSHCEHAKHKVSGSTLLRDVDVCLASYVPRTAASSKEDVAEPILAELPLLQQHTGTSSGFSFRRGPKTSLPDGLFAYALIDYWTMRTKLAVLPFDRIAYDYGSPGRVFKLDETSVGERVVRLEALTKGALVWTDSSGIRQVNRTVDQFTPELKLKLLEAAYA
jgi:hypothetical protein